MVGGVRPGVNGAKGDAGAGRGVAGAAATEAGAGAAMANRSICGFFVDKDLCGRISGPVGCFFGKLSEKSGASFADADAVCLAIDVGAMEAMQGVAGI